MNLDFLKDFQKIYNIPYETILFELIGTLKKEFYLGDVFFKGNRLYERYVNKEGIYKERKLRFTKEKILELSDKLKERLIQIDNQLKKQYIEKEIEPLKVIEGEIIGEDNYSFYIYSPKLKNYQIVLYKDKLYCQNKWDLGEKGYFFVRKIKLKNNSIVIYVDDFNINIEKYKIINILQGTYIKKIKFLKDKIIIKSIPKLDKEIKEKLKKIYNKKIIGA